MNVQTKETPMGRILWQAFLRQAKDLWQMPLICWAAALLLTVVMGIAFAVTSDPEALTIGVPALMAAFIGTVLSLFQVGSLCTIEYALGVHLSMPRRALLAVYLPTGLVYSAVTLLAAFVFHVGYGLAVSAALGQPAGGILGELPLWGWLAFWYLPVCIGTLGGGIIQRFGRKGFWALYAVFMLCCFAPSLLSRGSRAAAPAGIDLAELLLAALPWALPAVGLAALAAGVALLWAAPVTD